MTIFSIVSIVDFLVCEHDNYINKTTYIHYELKNQFTDWDINAIILMLSIKVF